MTNLSVECSTTIISIKDDIYDLKKNAITMSPWGYDDCIYCGKYSRYTRDLLSFCAIVAKFKPARNLKVLYILHLK